jgi:hypothetical protein
MRIPVYAQRGKKDSKFAPSFERGKAGAKAGRAFNDASTLKGIKSLRDKKRSPRGSLTLACAPRSRDGRWSRSAQRVLGKLRAGRGEARNAVSGTAAGGKARERLFQRVPSLPHRTPVLCRRNLQKASILQGLKRARWATEAKRKAPAPGEAGALVVGTYPTTRKGGPTHAIAHGRAAPR